MPEKSGSLRESRAIRLSRSSCLTDRRVYPWSFSSRIVDALAIPGPLQRSGAPKRAVPGVVVIERVRSRIASLRMVRQFFQRRRPPCSCSMGRERSRHMGTDRFGNSFAPSLPYARGMILASTADDYRKLERAYALIRQHGAEHVFVFTGLEHALPMEPEDLKFADDELAPALWGDRLRTLALGHLGGSPERHDVVVTNRLTGATLATFLTLVK